MGIDFFATVHKGTTEYPKRLDQKEFGIRDGEGGEPAFAEEKDLFSPMLTAIFQASTRMA